MSAVWPPSVGQHRVGRSRSMIVREDVGVERLDVGAVRELRVGHDRGGVRVDEDRPVALFAQHLARLGPRVVELARLADHDRPRADDQDRWMSVRRGISDLPPSRAVTHESSNRPKRYRASWGPGPASGWYWTEKQRRSAPTMPSMTPSFRLTWVTLHARGSRRPPRSRGSGR